jgi:ligand-binding SRPBCC domain-containing protein
MKIFTVRSTIFIPADINTCWEFFSSPVNLKTITPPYMGFEISSSPEKKMYPGQIITYIVRPMFGIPVQWVTEITHVKEKEYFVDEQRSGPYKFWHHKHFFRPESNGVEMTDLVHYSLPFSILGQAVHPFVRKKLNGIFDYRAGKIAEFFPYKNDPGNTV